MNEQQILQNQCIDCGSYPIRVNRINKKTKLKQFICKVCNKRFSERAGTVFQNCQLDEHIIMEIVRSFSQNESVSQCYAIVKERLNYSISKEAIRKFYNLFLYRIYIYTKNIIPLVQFENENVECDETYFYRFKRGRLSRIRYWVLGLISRESKLKVFYLITRRTKQALIPLIMRHLSKNCKFFTDSWSAYVNVKQFPAISHIESANNQIFHFCINHSKEYVSEINPNIYINTIERQWGTLKSFIRKFIPKRRPDQYISKHWFDQFYGGEERITKIYNILKLLKK